MLINYKDEDFNELIKDRVLVDFYATWCGPCQLLSPLIENLKDEIDIIKIDVDKNEELARQYGIMSIPCIILFEKGKEIKRNIGFLEEEKLKEFIKK